MGFISRTPACTSNSETLNAYNETDNCATSGEQITASGALQKWFLSCDPNGNGGQVVECEGFANDSDGCQWDTYMRRVGE